MLRVREHIHRLDARDAIAGAEGFEVARLRGRVAANVHDSPCSCFQDGLDHVRVHSGAWRIDDDYVRLSVGCDKLVGEEVFHIAGKEFAVGDAVCLGVDFGILDGFRDVFDADYPGCAGRDELRDGASAGVEVIDKLVAAQTGPVAGDLVELVGLKGVGLVEAFGANFEAQALHLFVDGLLALVEYAGLV